MVAGEPDPAATAGALALRLAAALLLAAAGLFLLLAFAITRLGRRVLPDGSEAYVLAPLPSGHGLDPVVVPILLGCAALLGAAGFVLLLLPRPLAARVRGLRAVVRPRTVLACGLLAVLIVLLIRRHGP